MLIENSNRPRYHIAFNEMGDVCLIRALQGSTDEQADLEELSDIEIHCKDTKHLFHKGHSANLTSLKQRGTCTRKSCNNGDRLHTYWSVTNPTDPAERRKMTNQKWAEHTKFEALPYLYDESKADMIYEIAFATATLIFHNHFSARIYGCSLQHKYTLGMRQVSHIYKNRKGRIRSLCQDQATPPSSRRTRQRGDSYNDARRRGATQRRSISSCN